MSAWAAGKDVVAGQAPRSSRPWTGSFVLLALMWGCSFALVDVGLSALHPVQVAFWRLTVGAVTLLAVSAATRAALPRDMTTWAHLTVLAILLDAVPFTLFAIGQQQVSSVLAGILNAATPLMTVVAVLILIPQDRRTAGGLAGLLLGFAGLLVVMGVWRGGGGTWWGVLACLCATVCYGTAFAYSRRFLSRSPHSPVCLATGRVTIAAVLMIAPASWVGLSPTAPVTAEVVVAVLMLGAFSSGLAYVLNFPVVARAGAATASSVTYLTPVVATLVGVLWLGEEVVWHQPIGALVVLAGVAAAQGRVRYPLLQYAPAPGRA